MMPDSQTARPTVESVDEVLITDELSRRESQGTEPHAENQALHALANAFGTPSATQLERLVTIVRELCDAGTAGVSLSETTTAGDEVFRWAAIVGAWTGHEGYVTPAGFSPCATCLERTAPQLYAWPGDYFTWMSDIDPPIVEALVLPLALDGPTRGTLWISTHDRDHRFDREHLRLLSSVAGFFGAACCTSALATENARLHDQVREEIAARHQGDRVRKAQQRALALERARVDADLRTSRNRSRAAFDQAAVGMVETDCDGRVLRANAQYCRTLGYSHDELVGRSVWDLTHVDDVDRNRRLFRDTVRAEQPSHHVEKRYIRKDGTPVWARVTANLVRPGADREPYILGVAEDIDDRKHTELALHDSERRLELALDSAELGAWDLDLVNDTAVRAPRHDRIFGYDSLQPEWNWKIFMRHVVPDYRKTVRLALNEALQTGRFDVEFRSRRPDRSVGWIAAHGRLYRNAAGEPVRMLGTVRDITVRKGAEQELRRSEEFRRRIIDSTDDCIKVLDLEGRLLSITESGQRLLEIDDPSPFLNQPWVEFWQSEVDRAAASEAVDAAANGGIGRFRGYFPLFRTRTPKWWDVVITPMLDDARRPAQLLAVSRDVTEQVAKERDLRDSETRLQFALDASQMGVWELDLATDQITADARLRAIYGFGPDDAIPGPGGGGLARIHPDYQAAVQAALRDACDPAAAGRQVTLEYCILRADGTQRWVLANARVQFTGEGADRRAARIIGTTLDITERKRLERQLHHSAFHDALTDLPNRALFMDRLEHVIARKARRGKGYALLMLDIDNFKMVNDSFGHPAGDCLLVEFARVAGRHLRPEDTFARLGGDEFCILVEEIGSRNDVLQVVERIQQGLREESLRVNGHEIRTSISVGVAFEHRTHRKPETALQEADVALYEAKHCGKNRYVIFEDQMRRGVRSHLRLEQALRRAVDNSEIAVNYQPIVDLTTGAVIGCEALARWHHFEYGHVDPAHFISLAEKTGIIVPLGALVLERVCREFAEWRRKRCFPRGFYVAVNLSARQFAQDDLVEQITGVMEKHGLEGRNLRLEVTEGSIISNGEHAVRAITRLQARGIRVCMDDFGVGYSSLSYLQRFPVSVLKLDRSFVQGLTEQPTTRAIVQTVLNLAQNLGLEAVAEGAECAEQGDVLRAMGFTQAQGFLFHHPMSSEAMAGLGSALKH